MGKAKQRKQLMSIPGQKILSCFTNGSKSCDAHTLYLQMIPADKREKSSLLPIVKNSSIVEAWKVSNYCSEVLSASEYTFYGTDKEVKDEIVQALVKNHGIEKENMLIPVIKTWKIFVRTQVVGIDKCDTGK